MTINYFSFCFPSYQPRVLGATQMVQELKKNRCVKDILIEMEKLASALISLAYAEIPKQQLEGIGA